MRNFNGYPCAATTGTVLQNSVLANSTLIVALNCKGAKVGDYVVVTPLADEEAGMMIGNGHVSAAGVVHVTAMNTTAGALPAAAAGTAFAVLVMPRD